MPEPFEIEVVAPNLKRRLSGVTATVVRLIPVQARMIGIVATGPGLPPDLPHIPLSRAATLPHFRAAGLSVDDFAISGIDGVTDALRAVKAGDMAS